jgi:hypothetical protein
MEYHMKRILTLALAGVLLAGTAIAQPGEYYLWKHKTNNKTMCNPDQPDANWIKVSGPYEDSNCKILQPK